MKPILLASLLAVGCVDTALPASNIDQSDSFDTADGVRLPQVKELGTKGMDQGTVQSVELDRNHQSGMDLSATDLAQLVRDNPRATIDTSAITVADLASFDNKSGISAGTVDWAPLSANWYAGSAGGRVCVVKEDTTVWCFGGAIGNPVQVQGLDNVASIALTDDAACALRHDGAIWCWGNNTTGEVGGAQLVANMPISALGLPTANAIAAGKDYFCANTNTSTFCWGGAVGKVPSKTVVHQFENHSALAFLRGENLVFASVSLLK